MEFTKLSSVSILIPAYNDSETITKVVNDAIIAVKQVARKFEIIVINDKSTDNTGAILDKLAKKIKELKVIHHPVNLGYGGTIKDLYYAGKSEWLFTCPGDNQIPPAQLIKLAKHSHEADIILGRRINRQDPPARLRQSKIYNFILNIFFGIDIHDVNTVRFMKQNVMDKIKLTSKSAFVDAEMIVRAKNLNLKIIEIPIDHQERADAGGGGGNPKTIIPTIMEMVWFWLTY
jgi:glycosyltransferase involved in cell wall biosynthesis